MTLSRLRESRRSAAPVEERAGGGGMSNFPYGGVGLLDPTAVPPPGMSQIYRAGVPVTAHSSLQTEAVFTAMRIITSSIIKLGDPRAYTTELSPENVPYRVWQETQPEILYNTFGPGQFQYDGRRRTVMSMGLFGEAFWHVLTRDRLGFPTALEVLHPLFMEVKVDKHGFPIFKYGSGTRKVELDPEDVVHIPFMSMPGGSRGLNSIEYGSVTIALALAAIEYGERWFSQGASPGFVLTTDNKLGRDELERVAEKFLIDHAGLPNSHLPLILDGGMKAQKIQSTPDEAQFLQALDLDVPILTATGWKTVGSVTTGDRVYAEDGTETDVLGVSPIFLGSDCYELEFSDGSTIVASGDHRWHVYDSKSRQDRAGYHGEWKTVTTDVIAGSWDFYGKHRYSIHCDGVISPSSEAELPIDPYILGYWFGDGHSHDAAFTVGLDDHDHLVAELSKAGLTVRKTHEVSGWGQALQLVVDLRLKHDLRSLGVLNNKCAGLPEPYICGSVEQRKSLLAGLLDSDGSGGKANAIRFKSIHRALAVDVWSLARSLGQRATIRVIPATERAGVKHSRDQYEVRWTPTFDPFRLERKSHSIKLWDGPRKHMKDVRRSHIVSVRRVESRPTRCIKVAHESHVFLVGRGFVATGNTLEFARSAIAAFFGIPNFLMPNILERQAPEPAGVIQERSMAFLQYTLSAYIVPLEEAYSSLVPEDVSVAFDTSKFAEPGAQQMAAEVMALRNTQTVTINDIRTRKLSLPPLDDPRADDPWAPLASNVAPNQTPGASPPDPSKTGPGTGAGHGPEPDPALAPDDSLD